EGEAGVGRASRGEVGGDEADRHEGGEPLHGLAAGGERRAARAAVTHVPGDLARLRLGGLVLSRALERRADPLALGAGREPQLPGVQALAALEHRALDLAHREPRDVADLGVARAGALEHQANALRL